MRAEVVRSRRSSSCWKVWRPEGSREQAGCERECETGYNPVPSSLSRSSVRTCSRCRFVKTALASLQASHLLSPTPIPNLPPSSSPTSHPQLPISIPHPPSTPHAGTRDKSRGRCPAALSAAQFGAERRVGVEGGADVDAEELRSRLRRRGRRRSGTEEGEVLCHGERRSREPATLSSSPLRRTTA